jgi:hypothetical protein
MNTNFLKSIVFLSLFSALPIVASAQQFALPSIGGTMWLGVRAGANFANETGITPPANATTSIVTGVIGGLEIEYWFDNSWALSASVLYDQKGVGEQYSNSAQNREVGNVIYSGNDNFRMTYLEIPVLLKYTMGRGSVRPYLAAGPSIGSLLSASETVSGTLAPLTDLKSDLQSLDLSVYGAVGLIDQIYHGPILSFEVGYAAGMSKLYKSSPPRFVVSQTPATDGLRFPDPIDPSSAKSGDFRVTIGAMWQL